MEEIKLNPQQSWSVISIFLESIREHCTEKFSDAERENLATYLSRKSESEWKVAYEIAFGNPLGDSDLLTPEEVFTLMIEHCALCFYKYEYGAFALLNLLYFLRYNPKDYVRECEFWQQAIERTIKKETQCRTFFWPE